MRYALKVGNSPDDIAIDVETDDREFVDRESKKWPYVTIGLLTPISREAIDAALAEKFPE